MDKYLEIYNLPRLNHGKIKIEWGNWNHYQKPLKKQKSRTWWLHSWILPILPNSKKLSLASFPSGSFHQDLLLSLQLNYVPLFVAPLASFPSLSIAWLSYSFDEPSLDSDSLREDSLLFSFYLCSPAQCQAPWDLCLLSSLNALWAFRLLVILYKTRFEIRSFTYAKNFKYLRLICLRDYCEIRIELNKHMKLREIGLYEIVTVP